MILLPFFKGGDYLSRKVKCPMCSTMNEKETTVEISKRFYCKECALAKEDNKDAYKRLTDYIARLYGINKPTGMIFKQIKDYKNKPYEFTDDGIYMTLKYYYETLSNNVLDGSGIGIVPYYYEKAKQHYLLSIQVEDSLENFVDEENVVVTINQKARNDLFNLHKTKAMTFDDLDWSEEDE